MLRKISLIAVLAIFVAVPHVHSQETSKNFVLYGATGVKNLEDWRLLVAERLVGTNKVKDWPIRTKVHLVNSVQEAQRHYSVASLGMTRSRIDRGKLIEVTVMVRCDVTNWKEDVLTHELAHAWVRYMYGHSIPIYIDEGIAQYAESLTSVTKRIRLCNDRILDKHFVDVFWGRSYLKNGSQNNDCYTLALYMVYHLKKKGHDKFLKFCEGGCSSTALWNNYRITTSQLKAEMKVKLPD